MYTLLWLQQVEEHEDCQPYAPAAFILCPPGNIPDTHFLEADSTPGP